MRIIKRGVFRMAQKKNKKQNVPLTWHQALMQTTKFWHWLFFVMVIADIVSFILGPATWRTFYIGSFAIISGLIMMLSEE